jgi:hypothetical protein
MKLASIAVFGLLNFAQCSEAFAEDRGAARLAPVPQSRALGNTLMVLREDVEVTCRADGERLRCQSSGDLVVFNPSGAALPLTLEVDESATLLAVNDLPVPLRSAEGQMVRAGDVVLPIGESRIHVLQPNAFDRDASARAAEVVSSVLVVRHPLLASAPGRPLGAELSMQSVGVTRRWKSVALTRFTLVYPSRWRIQPAFPECREGPSPASGCTSAASAATDAVRWEVDSSKASGHLSALITLSPDWSPLSNGGVIAGAGWGGGDGCLACTEAMRVRAGYEMGLQSWGILGLVGEVSTGTTRMLVPSLDYAAFPYLGGFFPALSIGMGFPVLLTSEGGGGMRWQTTGTWPFASLFSLGLHVHVDVVMTPSGTEPRSGLSLQLGL